MSSSHSRLFKPLKVGSIELQHRVAMAPLTRCRNNDDYVPLPFVKEYYGQRSSTPGTLLVTEATLVSEKFGGYAHVPGIWNQQQIEGWKSVTEEVHKKGSFIFQQLWSLGRTADPKFAATKGIEIKSASVSKLDDYAEAQEMSTADIQDLIAVHIQAAKNSIAAGFDGVEIHGANGYLIDQFLQDMTNKRTDAYGGSVENRSRLAFEIAKAVADTIGANRTAIRLSPFSTFQGMGMADPVPQFSNLLSKLNSLGLAYVHLVSDRSPDVASNNKPRSLTPMLDHYTSGPVLIAGGFAAGTAAALVDEEYKDRDVLVVFGRHFISTPDLVFRLQQGLAFNDYDRSSFYTPQATKGYIDYPFSNEFLTLQIRNP